MPTPPGFRLLLITDRNALRAHDGDRTRALVEAIRQAVLGASSGQMAVMVREKDLSARQLHDLVARVGKVAKTAGAPVLVNDRVDIALALETDGVHLPSSGLPPDIARTLLGESATIGVSTHSLEEVRTAAEAGASYVTFGPVLDTPSKRRFGPPVGIKALEAATSIRTREGQRFPVYALGGVTCPRLARQMLEAGAAGVAFIRAVIASDSPQAAAAAFLQATS